MISKAQRQNAERIVALADAFGSLYYNEHGQTPEQTLNLSIPCARLIIAGVVTGVDDSNDSVNDAAVADVEQHSRQAVLYALQAAEDKQAPWLVDLVHRADELELWPDVRGSADFTWYDSADSWNRRRCLALRAGVLLEAEREHPSDLWPTLKPIAGPPAVLAGARRIALHRGLTFEVDELTGSARELRSGVDGWVVAESDADRAARLEVEAPNSRS